MSSLADSKATLSDLKKLTAKIIDDQQKDIKELQG
jgi:uncharacterized protein (DUF305 family)